MITCTVLGKIECPDSVGELPQPGGDGAADFGAGVFLDEMHAGHCHLGLIGPGTAEIPDGAGQDAARLGVDEQLGQPRGRGQPGSVGGAYLIHVGWRPGDGDLAGAR